MKSRRNFITKAGIAATSILALNPFESLASGNNPFSLLSSDKGSYSLILLQNGDNKHTSAAAVTAIKELEANVIVLDSAEEGIDSLSYSIIHSGPFKTGVITVPSGSSFSAINEKASFLKKEKNCSLVVCLSALGFSNKGGNDDKELAAASQHIDFIITTDAVNSTPAPYSAKNKDHAEVLIYSSYNNGFGMGNISVQFDKRTNKKKTIYFNNLLTRLPETA